MRFGTRAMSLAIGLAAVALAAGAAPAFAAFGAFAYDESTGKYGASWNQATEKEADAAALKGCASDKCKIVFRTAASQCGALAATENGKAWGGAKRPKREEAEKAALANCQKRVKAGAECKVKTADCNK
jgi:ABC-type sugar transport system substrate-binding protein